MLKVMGELARDCGFQVHGAFSEPQIIKNASCKQFRPLAKKVLVFQTPMEGGSDVTATDRTSEQGFTDGIERMRARTRTIHTPDASMPHYGTQTRSGCVPRPTRALHSPQPQSSRQYTSEAAMRSRPHPMGLA